ncbi:MAG: transaldolase family protein [Conexivisphaerales archaeon]
MKIFIDSGDIDEIRESIKWGIIDGVTTNPSLIRVALDRRKGMDIRKYIREICETAGEKIPVSLEVMSTDYKSMVKEGRVLYDRYNPIMKNVVIKVPVNTGPEFEGLRAIKELSSGGIPINATLIMTPPQALLAAKAGARYVSPFLGRIDDYVRTRLKVEFRKDDYFDYARAREALIADIDKYRGNIGKYLEMSAIAFPDDVMSGTELLQRIIAVFRNYSIRSEVIAASIRNPRQMAEAMYAGADIATVPIGIIRKLLHHQKTEEGVTLFKNDAEAANYRDVFL